MTAPVLDITPRRAALVAGVGYLVIFVLAIFANFVVLGGLVETGDAAATARNIVASEGTFRAGIVAFTIVFVVDVPIAWALYIVFRDLGRDLSLLMAWMRLVYTVFLGVAVIALFVTLELLSGDAALTALDAGQIDALALLSIEAFDVAWIVGLACFGVHLMMVGVLIVRSGWTSKALGYVLMVAGTAYIVDTLARALIADYADVENLFLAIVAVPSVVGEFWFMIWLLRAGGTHDTGRVAPRQRETIAVS